MRCMACGLEFQGNFCPYCGTPSGSRGPPRNIDVLGSLVSASWLYCLIAFVLIIIGCVVALVLGVGEVVPNILSSGEEAVLFLIIPLPVGILRLGGYWFVGWYLFIFAVIVLSALWLFFISSKATWDIARRPLTDFRARLGSTSTISLLTVLFFANLSFSLVYYMLLSLGSVQPNVPIGEGKTLPWEDLYGTANAAVYEELITRVLFIGLILLILAIATRKPVGGLKGAARYIVGGGFDMNRVTFTLLIFSSSMFAVAHLFSWDLYKIPPTFVGGLILGYLYLKKGLFASILMHFSVNYLSFALDLLGDNLVVQFIAGLALLSLIAIGFAFFIYYVFRTYRFFVPGRDRQRIQSLESGKDLAIAAYLGTDAVQFKAPVSVGGRPYSYRCPNCGGVEARYVEGHFECLTCGYKA